MLSLKNIIIPMIILISLIAACDLGTGDPVDPGDPRDKFLGEWKVNESCDRGNYMVKIKPDPGNSAQVLLENFGNPGPGYDNAVGLVVSGSIIVSTQTIGEGWTVSGTGNYQSDGTISWTYTILIGANQDDCSAIFSK